MPSGNEKTDVAASTVQEDSSAKPEPRPTMIRWSGVLRSPQEPSFSPSREGKGHGWALLAIADRNRRLCRQNTRGVSLLLDVTTVYDQHAQALLKAGQSLNPLIAGQVKDAVAAQQSLVFWSGETSQLSSHWRTGLAPDWHAFWNTYGDSVHAIHEKYQQSRTKSASIRQRALRSHARYAKATQEAEEALSEWKNTRKEEELPQALLKKLKDVQLRKTHYEKLVEWENECVEQCESVEVAALDSLQKLEEDRLLLFSKSLAQTLEVQRKAFDEVLLCMKQQNEKAADDVNMSVEDRQKAFSKMKRSSLCGSILFEEGTGAMDAETIGLPEDVGQLRERVRSRMAARSTRVKTFRILAGCLEYVCVALERFSSSLTRIVQREQKGLELILDEMKENERSDDILDLWEQLVSTLRVEAEEAAKCAAQLRQVAAENLDSMVIYGDKLLQAAADSEEIVWKQLCEAARAQNKAEEYLVQTTAEKLKARERVHSTDHKVTPDEVASPLRVSRHVSRSLANMFSVLPNGGEHAMKILDRGTVASIAQHTLEDADEKELKGRQALEAAAELRNKVSEKYKANANTWLSQFDTEDRDGWGDLSAPFRALSSVIQSSRAMIIESIGSRNGMAVSAESCLEVMNQWVTDLQQRLSTETAAAEDGFGYKLSTKLVVAPTLTGWFPKVDESIKDVSADEVLDLEDDELDDESTEEGSLFPANNGSRDSGIFSTDKSIFKAAEVGLFRNTSGNQHDEDDIPKQEQSPTLDEKDANWLGMSNPMSDSLRGKFTFRKKNRRRYKRYRNVGLETDVFATYFWPDKVDPQSIPPVITSYACSMRDRQGVHYGRVFVSDVRLVFAGWTGKKLSLRLDEEISDIKPCQNPVNLLDNALQVTYTKKSDEEPTTVSFDGFFDRQIAVELLARTQDEAKVKAQKLRAEKLAADEAEAKKLGSSKPSVPPDSTLSKMEVVFSRHLRNISIQRFYEVVWSEGVNTTEQPLYGPWLKEGCMDVEVAPWEFVDFVGLWDKEAYTQKRSVSFRVKRKTHLYIGPPIADVKQTQYCRVEGQDKCVMGMTVEMEGIPYSDCFSVEVRWVARREGDNDILVEVGVFVDFKKSTLLKSKIRSGTLEETTSTHESLFECVKAACVAAGGEEMLEAEEEARVAPVNVGKPLVQFNGFTIGLTVFILLCLYYYFRPTAIPVPLERALSSDTEFLSGRIDDLEAELADLKRTLKEVLTLLKAQHDLANGDSPSASDEY